MIKNKVEILCPAGDFEAAVAATQNGADAIYLGIRDFSARQNATNFDEEALYSVVSYCHARGVLVYLTLNTIVFDSQLNSVVDAIKLACQTGVDAIIVQDFGVLSLVKAAAPSMPIHASTQMAVHTKKGAQLLSKLGLKRVVLARELSFAEIEDIAKNVDIETEVFVHGALCMSVSGQCYMSGMLGGRSGNRGNCAGTCRLPFSTNGTSENYDLSLKDNCLAPHVEQLIAIGVTSLKIEGRMKRPEYVAAAAKAYNEARNYTKPDTDILKAVFSRSGFTDKYVLNNPNGDMFGYRQKSDVVSATHRILKDLSNTYKKEVGRVPLSFEINVQANIPVTLTATDCDGNTATATGDVPQVAQNSPSTVEGLTRLLTKLGGTPFKIDTTKAEIGDGLVVPSSCLNELRRTVCDQILACRSVITPKPFHNIDHMRQPLKPEGAPPTLRARFATFEQIPLELLDQLEFIILPIDEVSKNRMALSPYKAKIIIEPYRIMFARRAKDTDTEPQLSIESDMIKKLSSLRGEGYRHLQADNIAHVQIANELDFTLHGGNFLNCVNSKSAAFLAQNGATDVALSFEIELKRANTIQSAIPLGLVVYGYLPLMIMKNCPIKAKKSCKDCEGKSELIDRMGVKFRVICNNRRYSEILNSTKLYMAERMDELRGISFAILYFTTEDKVDCGLVIEDYNNNTPAFGSFTRGLYYRGI